MKKTTVRIEGTDLSALTRAMEEKLKGYYEYFYDDTFIFVSENYYSRANENLMNVVIVFLLGNGESEVDVISGGGSGAMESWEPEDSSNRKVILMLKEICASNRWSLVEDKA
jgi:hypothetical protein